MKKTTPTQLLTFALIAAITFSLCACGNESGSKGKKPEGDEQGKEGEPKAEKAITAEISTAPDIIISLNTTSNYTRMIREKIYDSLTQIKTDREPTRGAWPIHRKRTRALAR